MVVATCLADLHHDVARELTRSARVAALEDQRAAGQRVAQARPLPLIVASARLRSGRRILLADLVGVVLAGTLFRPDRSKPHVVARQQ